jgi:hypothetical protein
MNRGFNAPYCGTLGRQTIWEKYTETFHTMFGYIFAKSGFKILIDYRGLEKSTFPDILIQYQGITIYRPDWQNPVFGISGGDRSKSISELLRLIDAMADPTGTQFLLCLDIKWAVPLLEFVLKGETCNLQTTAV